MQATREQLGQLASVTDAEDSRQLPLVSEVIAAWHADHCGRVEFSALLGLLERFPLSDGLESFWSIVHFLEACDGYEPELLASISRQPAELSLIMVNRLLNVGISTCEGIALLDVLQSVASREGLHPRLRKVAGDFVEYQGRKGRTDA
jgi:hypothetical protein